MQRLQAELCHHWRSEAACLLYDTTRMKGGENDLYFALWGPGLDLGRSMDEAGMITVPCCYHARFVL